MAYLANMKTYRIGSAFCVEPAILGFGRWYLVVLEEHLPDVWCSAGSNSHRLNVRLWHGRIRRMSITWITLTSLMFLSFMLLMQIWSPVSSVDSPHNRPLCSQEVSRMGVPDQNSWAAAQLAARGSVMENHPDCHPFTVSAKDPSSQVTLASCPPWLLRTPLVGRSRSSASRRRFAARSRNEA